MSANPATYASVFSADFVRASARLRRRRERVIGAVVGVCTAVVLLGLLAIPLFLLVGLHPGTPLSADTWQRFEVLLAGTLRAGVCGILVALPLAAASASQDLSPASCRPRATIPAGPARSSPAAASVW